MLRYWYKIVGVVYYKNETRLKTRSIEDLREILEEYVKHFVESVSNANIEDFKKHISSASLSRTYHGEQMKAIYLIHEERYQEALEAIGEGSGCFKNGSIDINDAICDYCIKQLLPQQAENLINDFVEQSKKILKDNLVGIYLHGSAVMGCFNPLKSDLDLIVVVERTLPDDIKRLFMDMVVKCNSLGPDKGIEMSVVLRNVCNPFIYPTPFELHFSQMHQKWYEDNPDDYIRKMKGEDKDLAAHFTIITNRGKSVYGTPIKEVFSEVPSDDYMDSILDDVNDAPEDIKDNTMYLILNLARVLAYKEEKLVLSKQEGGEWAIEHIPTEYKSLIKEALKEYSETVKPDYDIDLAKGYAEYMITRIMGDSNESL